MSDVESLSAQAGKGFAWLLIQTLASKGLTFLSQLILALLLTPADFGKIGMAYTVTAIAGLISNPGIDIVLIQRQDRLRRWITPAFWMALLFGLAASASILIAAPIGARLYHQHELVYLVAILAIATPINATAIVPAAILNSKLQFRTTAVIGLIFIAATTLLTIAFAYAGFGVYSFALPAPIVAAINSILLWSRVAERPRGQLQFRRWRYIIGDSALLFGVRAASTLISQGDYIILGLMYAENVVGAYFFGFSFAIQAIRLVAANISSIVMPALAKLNGDPERQIVASVRAAQMMGFIGIPLCTLQFITAPDLFHLLFGSKWDAAIPVVQYLSIGLAFDTVGWVGGPLANAQGRFRLFASLLTAWVPIFACAVGIGAWYGQSEGAAIGVAVYYCICSIAGLGIILRSCGGRASAVLELLSIPTLAAAGSAGAAFLITNQLLSDNTQHHMLRLLVLASTFGAGYCSVTWILAKKHWADVVSLFNQVVARRAQSVG